MRFLAARTNRAPGNLWEEPMKISVTRNTATAALMAGLLVVAATAESRAEAPGPVARHDLSEICAGDACAWEKVVTCSGFIEGINFDAEGRMWMVALTEGKILRIEGEECVAVGPTSGAPNGAKFAPDGRLFVTDRVDGLQAVDPETGERTQVFAGYGAARFRGLNDIVFDQKGGYYFTEPYGSNALARTGRVYYVAPGAEAKPEIFAEGLAFPNGVAVSADGQLVYVADFAENRVLALPSKDSTDLFGLPHVFARLEGGIGPDGLAVDTDENVYVVHYGAGELLVFDRAGFPYGSIPLPEGAALGSTNLAFKDGSLYLTEGFDNVVWRLPVKTTLVPTAIAAK